MRKFSSYLIVILTLATSENLSANEFRFSYLYRGMLIGGASPDSEFLQKNARKCQDFDISYLFGEDRGLIFGITTSVASEKYRQDVTSARPYETFQSDYRYIVARAGYWRKIQTTNMLFEVTGGFGAGTLTFKSSEDGSTGETNVSDVRTIEIAGRLIQQFAFEERGFSLDLIGGLGISPRFQPDFTYKGIAYDENDFGRKAGIDFQLGLGLSF